MTTIHGADRVNGAGTTADALIGQAEPPTVPRDLVRLASMAEKMPAESALVMLHADCDDRDAVDWAAAELGLTAVVSPDHTRYSASGYVGSVSVHVLCQLTEDPQARRDRLAAEVAALDEQIAQAGA